jgi:hypothetical protein
MLSMNLHPPTHPTYHANSFTLPVGESLLHLFTFGVLLLLLP